MCQNVPPLTISNKGTSYLSYFSRVALLYMQSILTERTWQRIPIEQISDDSFYDWLIQSYAIGARIFDYSQCFSFQNQPIWCESIKILFYWSAKFPHIPWPYEKFLSICICILNIPRMYECDIILWWMDG